MALSPLYRAAEATRRCPDCQRPIDRPRRYCDADRDRRRALTYLRFAFDLAGRIDDVGLVGLSAAARARDYIGSAIAGLGGGDGADE